jgi:hypothetical protein
MREFKDSITGKDRDEEERAELPAAAAEPARPATREPEVVTAEAQPEDRRSAPRAE